MTTKWDAGWNPLAEEPEHKPVEKITVAGVEVKVGDRVRLWPKSNADILDMAMRGKVAMVESLEEDFDGKMHVAVVLEDDPGRDLGMMRQPGHRFFYSPDEVEPVSITDEVRHER